MDYGGMGGIWDGRQMDEGDLFEVTMNRVLGDVMRSDETLCHEVWSALANVEWVHESGDTASYSFRAAGDLIAAIRGEGMYMDWYCGSDYATVSDRIREAMEKEGWKPTFYSDGLTCQNRTHSAYGTDIHNCSESECTAKYVHET